MNYFELLSRLTPEVIVIITALAVLAVDLGVMREQPRRDRFWVCAGFALLGCAAAAIWLLAINQPTGNAADSADVLQRMFVDDQLSRLIKVALLVFTSSTVLISVESQFTEHVGEYLALILLATVGMMLLASSTDLLMIFIALELTSLSLYVLTAFNKRNVKSVEAALKYFLFGGMAAAFTLYGLSLIYGLSGSTELGQIAAHVKRQMPLDPLWLMAIVITIIGFGFKIAVVPFHLWAPDAYEGAPTPSAALIASGSKLTGFLVLARVMEVALAPLAGNGAWHHNVAGWLPVLAILATASMALGNVTAIVQSDVKRLLAYSAIAHAGYTLVGLLANDHDGISAIIYYMITYGLTVIGAFGVVGVIEQNTGGSRLADFAGMSRRSPLLSICMLVFMLSLAGIPPLAGFFGKFFLFAAALNGAPDLGWLWIVIVAIATSAVSLYYYVRVLKQMYVAPMPESAGKIQVPLVTQCLLVLLAAAVVLLGCLPSLLLNPIQAAVHSAGF